MASNTTRIAALESAVTDLKKRVAALEARAGTGTSSRYTLTNVTTDRVLNANLYKTDELADVLSTLITDLGLKA